jgi:hypothetical protein
MITCLAVSAKFYDDVYYTNKYYAKVGGISNEELNRLEYCLLDLLDFNIFVPPDKFEDFNIKVTKNS